MDVYEQRIIVYADILGWSNACNDMARFPSLKKAADKIADYARKFSLPVKESLTNAQGVSQASIEQHAVIQFSFFSDNFAVSAPVNLVEMIFKMISFATHELLQVGLLIRGGVTVGGLYHNDAGVIFGPALVEAVDIEKKACYPRIVCGDSLIDFLDQTDYKNNVIIRDLDKKWVANIACGSFCAMTDLKKIIEEKLITQTKFKDKWQYMKDMFPLMYNNEYSSGRGI